MHSLRGTAVYAAGRDPGTLLTLRFSGAAAVLLVLVFGRRVAVSSGRGLSARSFQLTFDEHADGRVRMIA